VRPVPVFGIGTRCCNSVTSVADRIQDVMVAQEKNQPSRAGDGWCKMPLNRALIPLGLSLFACALVVDDDGGGGGDDDDDDEWICIARHK